MAKTNEAGAPAEQKPSVQRKQRIPVSGPRDILTVTNKDPNYVYRWVRDLPGRIQRFLDGGYEIVNHDAQVGQRTVDSGSRLGTAVTRQDGAFTLVLMRQLRDWYNEDQEAKQREIDALEDSMRAEGGNRTGMSRDESPDTGSFTVSRPRR